MISLAESELGRLALRGELEPVLATAGADYALVARRGADGG